MTKADIGLIGLAVMGENLVLNMESRGHTVAVYNRSPERTEKFASGKAAGKNILPCYSMAELCANLKKPRRVMMMVKAGAAVDELMEELSPHLEPGDILIDGGNSNYEDTERRVAWAQQRGLLFVGCGISGGEEGALKGPSMMPGGSEIAREHVESLFMSICARTDAGEPCCRWIGTGGSGHYVKMVHNGIEYGDMQLICEAYQLMRDVLGMSADEMAAVFRAWQSTSLDSYLISITSEVLAKKDSDGLPLVDKILDTAAQKGTGKWTSINALHEGVPLTMISEAVFARCLSAQKDMRVRAAGLYGLERPQVQVDKELFIDQIRDALYAAKIISYAQGFSLMYAASKQRSWGLDLGRIALIWRGGCIIRSPLLDSIYEAFQAEPELDNLLLSPAFIAEIKPLLPAWRQVVMTAAASGVPAPAMSSALSYFDGCITERLPANLLQGQRDYFGAHTYERVDAPRGTHFHTQWTE